MYELTIYFASNNSYKFLFSSYKYLERFLNRFYTNYYYIKGFKFEKL